MSNHDPYETLPGILQCGHAMIQLTTRTFADRSGHRTAYEVEVRAPGKRAHVVEFLTAETAAAYYEDAMQYAAEVSGV